MKEKLRKLAWVFTTFRRPLLFLHTLYRSGHGTALLLMRNGLQIEVRRNRWDSSIVMEMFDNCPYLLDTDLRPDSTVVDVGCYIGDFSLYVAKNCGARVIAFEPSPDNYEIARSNIERNRLGQLVQLNQLALGNGEPVTLYVRRHGGEPHVTSVLTQARWQSRSQALA